MLMSLFLVACGGGGSLDGSDNADGGTDDGSGDSAAESSVVLTLTMIDGDGNNTYNVNGPDTTLVAKLLRDGQPSEGVKVSFSLADDIGVLSRSGALTGSDGIASVGITAGDTEEPGTVTASITDFSASYDFDVSVSAVDVKMSDLLVSPDSIGPSGTATVSVTFTETIDGVTSPLSQPVVVQFSTTCAGQEKATIDTDITTLNGIAVATYKDNGCGVADNITATSSVGQDLYIKTAIIDVQPAVTNSISFKNVSNNYLALKGTGGSGRSEVSTVTFTVRDKIDNAVADTEVEFALTTEAGGIAMEPATHKATTDSNGEVSVVVSSGSVATPVRVVAKLVDKPEIATVSSELSVSTGIADFNSFSISASTLNPEAWAFDGVTVTITARLADHFNNPVYDGTTVLFGTEFGAISPTCLTVNGECSVEWRSQGDKTPNPALRTAHAITRIIGRDLCRTDESNLTSKNGLSLAGLPCQGSILDGEGLGPVYGNRVTIFAHVLGEESFVDSNGNGRFDSGEAYTDLTEAFRDDNNDGVFGGLLADGTVILGALAPVNELGNCSDSECSQPGGDNEEFIDLNSNMRFDEGNGIYNGVLCNENDNGCSNGLVTIYRNITILQAGSPSALGLIENGLDVTNPLNYGLAVDLSTKSKTVTAYVADQFNGYPPSGTSISFAAGNGTIVGPNLCTVDDSNRYSITSCSVTIKKDDEPDSGPLVVSVETPAGIINTRQIELND